MKLTDAPASVAEADDPGQPKYATLARRPSMRVIGTLWAVTVLAAMAELATTLIARDDLAHGDLASNLALAVSIVSYATLGALILRRAGNVIGWIMLVEGAAQAFLALASIYAVIGIATFPGRSRRRSRWARWPSAAPPPSCSRSRSCSCSSRPGRCRHGAGGRWPRPA